MVLRFANAIFEPIWTARFVDHVQITVAEDEGVGTRAALLRSRGRTARHGAEPSAADAVHDRDGAAATPPAPSRCATPSSTCCARCVRSATRTSRNGWCAASTARA